MGTSKICKTKKWFSILGKVETVTITLRYIYIPIIFVYFMFYSYFYTNLFTYSLKQNIKVTPEKAVIGFSSNKIG